jgi:hypothetical protein
LPSVAVVAVTVAVSSALDRLSYGGVEFVREAGHEDKSFDIAVCTRRL